MSPASYGFFVHSVSHQVVRIHDHSIDASSDPGRLRFPSNSFEGIDPVSSRVQILETVLSAGWIRVRIRGTEATVEHSWDWLGVIDAIVETSEELGLGPMTWLVIRHVGNRQEIGIQVSELLEVVRENRIEELIENIR